MARSPYKIKDPGEEAHTQIQTSKSAHIFENNDCFRGKKNLTEPFFFCAISEPSALACRCGAADSSADDVDDTVVIVDDDDETAVRLGERRAQSHRSAA